ncbi:MAG: FtsX-like permease family protein [Alphaproteobacteria bacterium]|nr:FtsX-like permease family protein [Alphaproteobacteria bacterium]
MIKRRSPVPFERERSERFLPFVIGAMTFLGALAVVLLFTLDAAMTRWRADLRDTLTVQIPATKEAGGERAEAVLAIVRATPGVANAQLVTYEEVERLLEPWLGKGSAAKGLPIPILIDITRAPGATIDRAATERQIQKAAPGATIEDHGTWLNRLVRLALSIQLVAAAIVMLIGAAAIAVVVFATRAGLAVHHDAIEILHLIGAQDAYIAREFQTRALSLGLRGGLYGLALAAVAIAVFTAALPDLSVAPAFRFSPDGRALVALVLLPVATALIALLTARHTVMRALGRMP